MKVWIVHNDCRDNEVAGVFDSYEKAYKFCKKEALLVHMIEENDVE